MLLLMGGGVRLYMANSCCGCNSPLLGWNRSRHQQVIPLDISDTAEIIAIIRDLVIIVFSVLVVVMVIMVIKLLLGPFSKISAFINSAIRTTNSVEEITTTVADKIESRAVAGSGVAFGIGKITAFLLGLRRKRRRGEGGVDDG